MSILSRLLHGLGVRNSSHVKTMPTIRRLTIEPLEDRRLLAAAPLNFTVAKRCRRGR